MVTIPRSVSETQPSDKSIIVLLSNSLRAARERIKVLEQQITWENELFANPHLSPGHKLTYRATVDTMRKAGQPQDGLTKIYIPAIAEKVGLSPKTVGKNLQFLADTGALVREAETDTDTYGQRITRVFIGLTEQVNRPEQIQPAKPRNHGGLRSFCPACGSENLLEEKKTICTDCGTVISSIQRPVNQKDPEGQIDYRSEDQEAAQPTDNLTEYKTIKEPTDNLTAGYEKPTSPPMACSTCAPAIIGLPMSQEQEHTISRAGEAAQQTERDLEQAAHLLLDITGDTPEYIVMNTNPAHQKKYLTVHRRLTLTDMRSHLTGRKTYGATLQHDKGTTTRALCFDEDDPHTWQSLKDAAISLAAQGYKPLLEPSPAQRGGHLWLIFSDKVNSEAAYGQVVTIAPQLKEVMEYWPSRGEQKVRLPAGKYVTPDFSEWTIIYDAEGQELSKNGIEAARMLLTHQTPADLIPATGEMVIDQTSQKRDRQDLRPVTTTPDAKHKAKYGKHAMWVEWPDEQYLIDRFNSEHSIDDLATYERSGMINAAQIGRPERTASVGVTPDGQRFTDFGKGARKEDGTQEGGDPFEFYIRSQQREKAEVLRELGQQLNREASREIIRAAREGEQPPLWVMEILTDTGRQIYNENAAKHGHPPLVEHSRGVVGFSTLDGVEQPQEQAEIKTIEIAAQPPTLSESGELWQAEGDYPPPDRPCLHCKVRAWKWTGDKYICSDPGHPPE